MAAKIAASRATRCRRCQVRKFMTADSTPFVNTSWPFEPWMTQISRKDLGFDLGNTTEPPGRTVLLATACMSTTDRPKARIPTMVRAPHYLRRKAGPPSEGNTKSLRREVTLGDNGEAVETPVNLASVTVLADVKIRWDSVFYMLRRPVLCFLALNHNAHKLCHQLENKHWSRLELMELILQNWTPEDHQEAKKIIMDKIGQSTTLAFTGIAQAAKWYCNVSQSLDFTATAGSTTGGQSLDDEVNHYMTSRLPSRKSTDMVGYWMTESRQDDLAQDFLPLPSSSVETDTTRRNRTNALLMEALQMLKFNFKRAQLNFMAEWQSAAVPDEEDWLRILASAADGRQAEIWCEISEMPEEN
ncbi:hypothetical protein FB451DRAFT_1180731 [Mycena latifolia]|nr:hypothetical protein FB451DRAFT_1180731 [Mycena latifolia]